MGKKVIEGTRRDDIIVSDDVTRVVNAKSGDDQLTGNDSNETLLAGTKNSRLEKTYGDNDTVFAGGGNDLVFGLKAKDKLYGEDGEDELFGGGGKDKLFGGANNDKLYGNRGKDKLDGGTDDGVLAGSFDTIIDIYVGVKDAVPTFVGVPLADFDEEGEIAPVVPGRFDAGSNIYDAAFLWSFPNGTGNNGGVIRISNGSNTDQTFKIKGTSGFLAGKEFDSIFIPAGESVVLNIGVVTELPTTWDLLDENEAVLDSEGANGNITPEGEIHLPTGITDIEIGDILSGGKGKDTAKYFFKTDEGYGGVDKVKKDVEKLKVYFDDTLYDTMVIDNGYEGKLDLLVFTDAAGSLVENNGIVFDSDSTNLIFA